MKINIKIRKSNKQKFVQGLTEFFHKELGLESSTKNLTVKTYQNFCRDTGAMAGANWGKRDIEVALDSRLTGMEIITTLSHEMIHVKQMARGKLTYINDIPYWCGEKADHYEYENRPWEIHAYKEMVDLVNKLCDVYAFNLAH